MSMDGLRKGASNLNSGSKGKGFSRPAFYAKWKPPQIVIGAGLGKYRTTFDLHPFLSPPPHEESKIEAAEPIVLIAGQYEDIYAVDGNGARIIPPPVQEGLHFRAHNFSVFMKPRNPQEKGFTTFRELYCSSGPDPHAPQPCIGCYEGDHGAEKSTRARDGWVFNMAHLAWYHLMPALNKDGQVQMKKDNSGPIMNRVQCTDHKMENVYLGRAVQAGRVSADIAKKYKPCDGCQQRAEWSWGDHRVLQLGFKHLKNLFEIDDRVGKQCINCGTGILRIAFDCEKCGNELLNLAQVSWTNDQIDQYMKMQQQCSCGHLGLPKSAYECGFDDNFNQVKEPCENPQKTTIFDCVLWVQREGESTDSEIVVKRVELISQYKTQDQRPLSEHLKEIVKDPFDLAEMYKPDNLEDQAETIQRPNPYAQQQQQYTGYGQQPGGYAPPGQPGPGYQPPQGYPQGPGPGGYVPPQTTQPYQPPGAPQQGPGPANPQPGYPQTGRPNYGR